MYAARKGLVSVSAQAQSREGAKESHAVVHVGLPAIVAEYPGISLADVHAATACRFGREGASVFRAESAKSLEFVRSPADR